MADLGAIGKEMRALKSVLLTTLYTISGTYQRDAVNAFGRIYAFDRTTQVLVGATISHPTTGAWSMVIPNAEVIIVATDDGNAYNARIFDHVTPL